MVLQPVLLCMIIHHPYAFIRRLPVVSKLLNWLLTWLAVVWFLLTVSMCRHSARIDLLFILFILMTVFLPHMPRSGVV